MKTRIYLAGLTLMLFFLGGMSLSLADEQYSDDWKIDVGGKAKSAGKINFKLSFKPGDDGAAIDPVSIDVLVAEDTKENDVAALMTNNFRAVLGDDSYKIKTSWGNNVTVKTRSDTPDFVLELTGSSVQGISVEIDD